MRTFNINISNVMVGGTKEEIAKIPVFKYRAPAGNNSVDQQMPDVVDDTATHPQESNHTMKRANYFKKIFKRTTEKKQDDLPKTNKYLTIPKVEDAVCTICLSEYEDDELVCKLW